MRIKLVQSKRGYAVFFKRFWFQPFWYYTDYSCIKAHPRFTFDNTNYKDTVTKAIRNTLKFFDNHYKQERGKTIKKFKSVEELRNYL
jgi:hypothetical protein